MWFVSLQQLYQSCGPGGNLLQSSEVGGGGAKSGNTPCLTSEAGVQGKKVSHTNLVNTHSGRTRYERQPSRSLACWARTRPIPARMGGIRTTFLLLSGVVFLYCASNQRKKKKGRNSCWRQGQRRGEGVGGEKRAKEKKKKNNGGTRGIYQKEKYSTHSRLFCRKHARMQNRSSHHPKSQQ